MNLLGILLKNMAGRIHCKNADIHTKTRQGTHKRIVIEQVLVKQPIQVLTINKYLQESVKQ